MARIGKNSLAGAVANVRASLSKGVAASLAGVLLFGSAAFATAQSNQPHITGMAHIGYYITNLKQARDYYEGYLGFQEAFTLKNPDGSPKVIFLKINDHQYIELFTDSTSENYGYIHDAGLETNDAKGMRDHLASLGIKVPNRVTKNEAGNLSFDIQDPSGFTIEIVQYVPGSKTSRSKGKFMSASAISDHIDHIGLLVKDRSASWKFYSDAFGFVKEGDGSKMSIPGSPDRFELGNEKKPPAEARFHIKDHICLSNADVPKVTADLKARPQNAEFPEAIADIHQLPNGKHVIEIYDTDKNRIELMEPAKEGDAATEQRAEAAAPTPAECGIPGHHALLERMSEAFTLSCPQEQKLEPLLHDEESVSKPLLAFAAFTPEEKKDVMLQVKVAARKQIRSLLTPDQQAKMDQEIDTVSKGGAGLHKAGGGKKGGAKKETQPVDPFQAQDALCKAISNYSAFTDTEKKALILKVKQAALRSEAPAMTAEQMNQVKVEIQQL